jgi:hypothetical protein
MYVQGFSTIDFFLSTHSPFSKILICTISQYISYNLITFETISIMLSWLMCKLLFRLEIIITNNYYAICVIVYITRDENNSKVLLFVYLESKPYRVSSNKTKSLTFRIKIK